MKSRIRHTLQALPSRAIAPVLALRQITIVTGRMFDALLSPEHPDCPRAFPGTYCGTGATRCGGAGENPHRLDHGAGVARSDAVPQARHRQAPWQILHIRAYQLCLVES